MNYCQRNMHRNHFVLHYCTRTKTSGSHCALRRSPTAGATDPRTRPSLQHKPVPNTAFFCPRARSTHRRIPRRCARAPGAAGPGARACGCGLARAQAVARLGRRLIEDRQAQHEARARRVRRGVHAGLLRPAPAVRVGGRGPRAVEDVPVVLGVARAHQPPQILLQVAGGEVGPRGARREDPAPRQRLLQALHGARAGRVDARVGRGAVATRRGGGPGLRRGVLRDRPSRKADKWD